MANDVARSARWAAAAVAWLGVLWSTELRAQVPASAILFTVMPTAFSEAADESVQESSPSDQLQPVEEGSQGLNATSQRVKEILSKATEGLDADQLPKFDEAKAELQAALVELESFIKVDSPNGKAWSHFLRLDEIREALESENPRSALFVELEMNMRQNYAGLELAQFVRLRNGLSAVSRALKYGQSPERTIAVLNARINNLIKKLDEPAVGAASQRNSDVGLIANYLHESGQASWAVEQLREEFNHPNVQVLAEEELLNELVGRVVAEPNPVDECILGTRVLGRACLTGSVGVDVLPMESGVLLQLNLSGQLTSNNRGYNRGVVLRTSGVSPVYATKRVSVTDGGIAATPAVVTTNLRTQIHSIEHPLGLIRRIAKKKAAQQKPLADSIAQGRMQRKLQRQYDDKVSEQLVEANRKLKKVNPKNRPELKRIEMPQPEVALYSTDDAVHAKVLQAATFQLAASAPCALPVPQESGVVFAAHQSVAINAIESFLAGRTIRNHDLDDLAKQFLGEVPEELLEESQGDSWEITMASYNPIQVEFDDDHVKITLRIARMQGNDRTFPSGAIISATYFPTFEDDVLNLGRVGDLEIAVPGVRSSIQATSLRSVAKKKFDDVLKSEIETEEIDIQELFPNAPELTVDEIKIDDGWIQIGIH